MIETNHRILASHKAGVWKKWIIEQIVFGVVEQKVIFNLASMPTCCWEKYESEYEPFITHKRGILTDP